MIARLFERILPSSALKWGRLTKPYPDLHADVAARIAAAVKASGVTMEEARLKWETGGPIPQPQPIILDPADFPLVAPTTCAAYIDDGRTRRCARCGWWRTSHLVEDRS